MKISVYITSYNQKQYLVEAIESVLAQTLKPRQIIIIDDCSNDGSQEIIAGFHSRYPHLITPIYHTQNYGITYTRIEALQHITEDYVTFVDGDDRFLPTKLEKEALLIKERPDAHIAFSNIYYIDEQGNRIGIWADNVKPPEGDIFCQTFAREFPKGNLFRSELVNYQAWKQIGFHDLKLHNLYEDYEMRIRLTRKLCAAYYDEPLSEYRLHGTGLSRVKFARHFVALEYIYLKHKSLLNKMDRSDRERIKTKLGIFMTKIARHAIQECLQEHHRFQAVRLLFAARNYDTTAFNWLTLAEILLPVTIYQHLVSHFPPKKLSHSK